MYRTLTPMTVSLNKTLGNLNSAKAYATLRYTRRNGRQYLGPWEMIEQDESGRRETWRREGRHSQPDLEIKIVKTAFAVHVNELSF